MYVTEKQKEIAHSVNFVNYMLDEHDDLIEMDPASKTYVHTEHDSLKFYEDGYYRFSTSEGGDGIRFLEEYCGLTYPEAVMELYNYANGEMQEKKRTYSKKNQNFSFPEKSPNYYKKVFSYLTNTRKISPDTVKKLIHDRLLYEDTRGNAVFVNQKKGREIAILRGTLTYAKEAFKRIDTSESNNYWVFENQNVDTVYVCESPIDAISLYELYGQKSGAYIAMAGVKDKTLQKIISDYPESQIVIATDWDEKGAAFAHENKNCCSKILRPDSEDMKNTKDWNDILRKKTH